jgi:non-ribosomal peptide synthetase component F
VQTFAGGNHNILFDSELADEVRDCSQAQRVTPYMLLLGTFATLLHRRTGQDDILLGGPMANRDDPGFEHLIGFFANTIVVRTQLGGDPRFVDALATVRESVLASYEHQEVPLELVVNAVGPQRHPGANPLFQVNFRVRVGGPAKPELPGAETSVVPVDLGLARFDLALELHLLDDGLSAEFNYNTALFDRATVQALAEQFERLLRQVVADPRRRLSEYELEAQGEGEPSGVPAPPIRGFRRAAR